MNETIAFCIDLVLHLDRHLAHLSASLGSWMYLILFTVIFCETGLVVTPFLPGDSLLFAVGTLVAIPGSDLSFPLMFVLLNIAAVAGDAVNYGIGRVVGPRVFRFEDSFFWNREHLQRAQQFYEKHGGKAIFLARFVPIIRTFAPFVAGVGQMNYFRFWVFNVSGGICWVGSFLGLGYLFGNTPFVKRNLSLMLPAIIVLSVLPIAFEWYRARRTAAAAAAPNAEN